MPCSEVFASGAISTLKNYTCFGHTRLGQHTTRSTAGHEAIPDKNYAIWPTRRQEQAVIRPHEQFWRASHSSQLALLFGHRFNDLRPRHLATIAPSQRK